MVSRQSCVKSALRFSARSTPHSFSILLIIKVWYCFMEISMRLYIVLPVEFYRLLAGKKLYSGAPGQSHSREFFTLKGISAC